LSVVQINSETLLQFIVRIGVVNAENVQQRFGWTDREARSELRKLVKAGKLLEVPLQSFSEGGYGGRRLEWRICEMANDDDVP
jgi:hypothetical protein